MKVTKAKGPNTSHLAQALRLVKGSHAGVEERCRGPGSIVLRRRGIASLVHGAPSLPNFQAVPQLPVTSAGPGWALPPMNLGGDVLDTLPAPPEGVQVALLGAAALPGLGGRAAAGGAAAAGGFGAGAQPGAAGVPGYPGDNGPPPATPGYPGVKLPEWLTLPSPSQVMQGIKDGLMITNPVIGIGISIMESVGAGPKDITDANPAIHEGQQGKHVPGHNNFDPTRSPLNADVNPQQLLDGAKSGAYPVIGHGSRGDPVVDSGRNIGVDSNSGDSTSYGTIHSGKKGSHIVPANPNLFGPKK